MLGGLSDGQAAATVSERFLSGQLQQLIVACPGIVASAQSFPAAFFVAAFFVAAFHGWFEALAHAVHCSPGAAWLEALAHAVHCSLAVLPEVFWIVSTEVYFHVVHCFLVVFLLIS